VLSPKKNARLKMKFAAAKGRIFFDFFVEIFMRRITVNISRAAYNKIKIGSANLSRIILIKG